MAIGSCIKIRPLPSTNTHFHPLIWPLRAETYLKTILSPYQKQHSMIVKSMQKDLIHHPPPLAHTMPCKKTDGI